MATASTSATMPHLTSLGAEGRSRTAGVAAAGGDVWSFIAASEDARRIVRKVPRGTIGKRPNPARARMVCGLHEEKFMSDHLFPLLMFEGRAEEAVRFYVSVFPDAKLMEIARYGKGAAGAEGSVSRARLAICGQVILCTDHVVKSAFTFTPAISLFVECRSRDRMRGLVERLSEGGQVFMPLDDYGFSKLFAWIADKFGVSWQLSMG